MLNFESCRPGVSGTNKLLRRLESELRLVKMILAGEEEPTESRLQGLKNNVDGIRAELLTATQAPDVVALGKRFYSPLVSERGVEVDVVASNGSVWIEVKKHHSFSTGSRHWGCRKGRSKGILQQAKEMVTVSRDPSNVIFWQSPQVVFRFIGNVDNSVRNELEELGIIVLEDDGNLDVLALPERLIESHRVNLDVTTLCCLVSEISNGGANTEQVRCNDEGGGKLM